MVRASVAVLLALSGVAYADDLVLPVGGGSVVPVGDLTLPGALVMLGWLIARWKPTVRVEVTDTVKLVITERQIEEVTREAVRRIRPHPVEGEE